MFQFESISYNFIMRKNFQNNEASTFLIRTKRLEHVSAIYKTI